MPSLPQARRPQECGGPDPRRDQRHRSPAPGCSGTVSAATSKVSGGPPSSARGVERPRGLEWPTFLLKVRNRDPIRRECQPAAKGVGLCHSKHSLEAGRARSDHAGRPRAHPCRATPAKDAVPLGASGAMNHTESVDLVGRLTSWVHGEGPGTKPIVLACHTKRRPFHNDPPTA
jgi:hypothetical protein